MQKAQAILDVIGPFLEKVPDGTVIFLECGFGKPPCLEVQASTQAKVLTIRACFPPTVWKREWDDKCGWWTYTAKVGDVTVKMYAVRENPAQCRAITEKRMVKKQVAVTFEEQEEEQEVIVGWDCGKQPDDATETTVTRGGEL